MVYKLLTVDNISEETDDHIDAYSLGMKEIEVSEETYDSVIREAGGWAISVTYDEYYDYGYSCESHEQKIYQEELNPESIVVKDGKFAGCYLKLSTYYFNKVGHSSFDHCILFTNGTHVGSNLRGDSFSGDDYERSTTYTYSLVRK